jgi:hypothetical protein
MDSELTIHELRELIKMNLADTLEWVALGSAGWAREYGYWLAHWAFVLAPELRGAA